MVRGEIVFEDYAPGWTADKPHLLASGTKSFCGVMAACAVHDGLITLDEKVAETLTEWKDDQRKSQSPADISEKGTVTTSVYSAVTSGAATEFVVDAEGGHGWPGSRSRRDGNAPIKSFSGAERVWEFFKDKHR